MSTTPFGHKQRPKPGSSFVRAAPAIKYLVLTTFCVVPEKTPDRHFVDRYAQAVRSARSAPTWSSSARSHWLIEGHSLDCSHFRYFDRSHFTYNLYREYIGLVIEIQPGYDRFVQSADPVIQAQLMAAKRGDLVYITGVVKGKGGTNTRIKTFKTLASAPEPGPVLVEAADEIAA